MSIKKNILAMAIASIMVFPIFNTAYATSNNIDNESKVEYDEVIFSDWYKDGQNIIIRDDYASDMNNSFIVEDYETGKKFNMIRTGGSNHADVEPVSIDDSKIIKEIWGGFSWSRRPVLIHIDGKVYGASMTAMPHAGLDSEPARAYTEKNRSDGYGKGINYDSVKGNDVDGHMDIHLLNSMTHTSKKLDSAHQNNIKLLMDKFN